MSLEDLPSSWTVWSDEPEGRVVLAYRPDVFDSEQYPPPCLPTIYVTKGPPERRRPPGDPRGIRASEWRVTLFLEPEVDCGDHAFDARADALDGAVDLATAFDAGEVDYRGAYQVPREDYLARLDELTGSGSPASTN